MVSISRDSTIYSSYGFSQKCHRVFQRFEDLDEEKQEIPSDNLTQTKSLSGQKRKKLSEDSTAPNEEPLDLFRRVRILCREPTMEVTCPRCTHFDTSNSFQFSSNYAFGLTSFEEDRNHPLRCSYMVKGVVCGKSFSGKWRRTWLQRHIAEDHTERQHHRCQICAKSGHSRSYKRYWGLQKHKVNAHGFQIIGKVAKGPITA